MKKILLVEDSPEILELLGLIVEGHFENPVLSVSSGNEAVKLLSQDPDVGVIVSDYTMPNGNGGVIYNYNLAQKNLPFIFISGGHLESYEDVKDFFSSNSLNCYLTKPIAELDLIAALEKALATIRQPHNSHAPVDLCRVHLQLLIKYLQLPVNIYLRLSAEKFIKVLSEENDFDLGQLVKYQEKNIEYLYVEQAVFQKIKKQLFSKVAQMFATAYSVEESYAASSEVLSLVSSQLNYQHLAITPEQVALINAAVQSCLDNFKKNPDIDRLLANFFKQRGYLVGHSLASIHISYMIAKKMDTFSDQTLAKLTYAGIFHDLSLDSSQLSAVLDLGPEQFSQLTPNEKLIVQGHPASSVKLFESSKKILADITNIIYEHHEKPDGTGFPRGIHASRISPLGAVFILALKTADALYYWDKEPEKFQQFKQKLLKDYDHGNFKRPLQALGTII